MSYNIKATLSPTKKLVRFDDIFNGTKNAFLDLVRHRIPPAAQGQFTYGTLYGGSIAKSGDEVLGLSFASGGFWSFATLNKDLMFNVYEGISRNQEFAFGMYIDGVNDIRAQYVTGDNFVTCKPGLVVRDIQEDGTIHMYTMLNDGQRFIEALEDNTIRKVRDLAPHLDPSLTIRPVNGEVYKRKRAWIDNSYYTFNEGVFIINTSREVMDVLSCVGLGDLTHLGFGHIFHRSDPTPWNSGVVRPPLRPSETLWSNGEYLNGQPMQSEYR